jgi:membrane protease YdiL (CAAX protease family)
MRQALTRHYGGLAARHPIHVAVLALIVLEIAVAAIVRNRIWQTLVYGVVISACVIVVDAMSVGRAPAVDAPVRRPAGELLMLIVCWLTAMAWLTCRFVFHMRPAPGLLALGWAILALATVFNALQALWLLASRYRLRDLGLRWSGMTLALPALAIFAVLTLTASRGSMTIGEIRQMAPLDIVLVALSAAVPEEFFRFVWQTRVGAWCASPATGWLIATAAWAMLHGPKDFDDAHAIGATVQGIIDIVPLGLLWGYLTRRTGSFLPSALLHATNVWGLQNL